MFVSEPGGKASILTCGLGRQTKHSVWLLDNERHRKSLNMNSLYPSLGSCRAPPTMLLMTLKSDFPGTHITVLKRPTPIGLLCIQWFLHLSLNAQLFCVQTWCYVILFPLRTDGSYKGPRWVSGDLRTRLQQEIILITNSQAYGIEFYVGKYTVSFMKTK